MHQSMIVRFRNAADGSILMHRPNLHTGTKSVFELRTLGRHCTKHHGYSSKQVKHVCLGQSVCWIKEAQ